MNRINPLHVVALLVVILIFVVLKLNGAKEELQDTKSSYEETLTIATELNGLSEIYSDKKDVKKSLTRILKQSSLKSANIDKKFGKSSVVISSESMDKTALNSLMGKILNGSYDVTALKIKRLSDIHVSLKMEIKW